jgi:hypothetical protein
MRVNYAMRYSLVPEMREEGYQKNEAGDKGLADALVCISILNDESGSSSQMIFSINGKNHGAPLSANDLFKCWCLLGLTLYDSGDLYGWKNDIAKNFCDQVRQIFKR